MLDKNCIVEKIGEFTDSKEKSVFLSSIMSNSLLLKERAEKIYNCGTLIGLAEIDNSCRVVAANFCRQRLCPMCQRRRSLRTYSAMSRVYDIASADGYAFLHIVLTLPNCDSSKLDKTITFLYKKSSLLFRKNSDIHTKAACGSVVGMEEIRKKISTAFKGVFRALEVTYNEETNTYHPHLHCLVAVKKSYFSSRYYVKYEDLRKVWSTLCGVDNLQIFMGKVTDNCSAIAEIAKYCVKPFKNEPTIELLETLHKALYNRRLTQNYGVFKEWFFRIGVEDLENPLDMEIVPASVWLSYEGGVYCID